MTDPRWQLAAYVFVSMVMWSVSAQLSWRRSSFAWIDYLARPGPLASLLRFVYYVGLPYAALILGAVPARYLGLVGLESLGAGQTAGRPAGLAGVAAEMRRGVSLLLWNWLPDVGRLAGLGALMLVLLGLVWLVYGRVRRSLLQNTPGERLSTSAQDFSIVRSVYQAIHWSFYRSAVWLLWGDLYLAVVGGLALVLLEWASAPQWADSRRRAQAREELLVDASVLVSTSMIFFFVPNLWLLVPLHWMLGAASRRLLGRGRGGAWVRA
jgi:hypothetical protein